MHSFCIDFCQIIGDVQEFISTELTQGIADSGMENQICSMNASGGSVHQCFLR